MYAPQRLGFGNIFALRNIHGLMFILFMETSNFRNMLILQKYHVMETLLAEIFWFWRKYLNLRKYYFGNIACGNILGSVVAWK
jgi:hypothetical protein